MENNSQISRFRDPFLLCGVAIYLACLPLTAFYVGEHHTENSSYGALMDGIFGLLYGYWAWLANPLFLISLLTKNRVRAVFAVAAFAFTLHFMFTPSIPINEAPTYEAITARSFGYFLWVAALAINAIGALFKIFGKTITTKSACLIAVAVLVLASAIAFMDSRVARAFHTERTQQFAKICSTAKERIIKKIPVGSRIYLDESVGSVELEPANGKFTSGSWGVFLLSDIKRAVAEDKKSDAPFELREFPAEAQLFKRYEISGAKLQLVSSKDNEVLVESAYFTMGDEQVCTGGTGARYSVADFIDRAIEGK